VSVDYTSTINRSQGATVDEAHLLLGDRTNSKQLYVGATRGGTANHIHTAPPAFDPDQHAPGPSASEWTPKEPSPLRLPGNPTTSAHWSDGDNSEHSTHQHHPKESTT